MQRLEVGRSHWALQNLIAQRIRERPQQRITFAEYMDWVLYEPQLGYYAANRARIGAGGDFFTSPHLGQDFGELLAEQFLEMWQHLGQPVPFTLVEMGAGQGLVAGDILNYVRSHHPDFLAALQYVIVEQAAALIAEQKYRLKEFVQTWGQLTWQTLAALPPDSITGCFFSNELVDALPVHLIQLQDRQLREVYVTLADTTPAENTFVEVVGELSTPRLQTYFDLIGVDLTQPGYPEGYRTEVNLAALDWLTILAQGLQRGYCLTIDYGYTASQYYSPARSQGTLQCYYQHAVGNHPYQSVGYQDITAHINFTALERQGELVGMQTLGFTQQGLLLMALGLGDRLSANNTATTTTDLNLILRRREALHQLMHPLGLGGFGVLLQSKGLTASEQAQSLRGFQTNELIR